MCLTIECDEISTVEALIRRRWLSPLDHENRPAIARALSAAWAEILSDERDREDNSS